MERGPTVVERGGCAHALGMLFPSQVKGLVGGRQVHLTPGKEPCGWSPGRLGPSAQTPPLAGRSVSS